MRKIKVVVLLVQQLQHGFTKNAKVSPNLTVAHIWLDVLLTLTLIIHVFYFNYTHFQNGLKCRNMTIFPLSYIYLYY